MNSKLQTKCKNCGAVLTVDKTIPTIKCDYCGTVYQNQTSPPCQPQGQTPSATDLINNTIQPTTENPVGKGCAWIFLIAVSLLAILAVCDKDAKCTRRTFNLDGLDDPLPHVKKTNPDPDYPLSANVSVTDSNTVIEMIMFNNTLWNSDYKPTVIFQILDKDGKEIKTGESNIKEFGYLPINPLDSTVQKFSLKNRLLKAKSVAIKYKQIENYIEIWDYQ